MAWMSSHLFVRSIEHDQVVDAVAELVAQPDHRASQEGLLDAPGPVVVSPPHEGWTAVCGARAWIDDLVWAAARLSTACRCLVVSCEILGNAYRLRLSEHEGGAQRRVLRTPEGGWLDQPDGASAMPRYDDVELLAWRSLRELGIAAPLVVLGTAPLGYASRPPLALGEAVRLAPGATVERSRAPLSTVPFEGDDPPVLPAEASSDFGLTLFERRYVEGKPSDAAVDRLLQIEDDFLARAKRARPEAQVSLTVTYHGGEHQEALDDLLRARGRPTAAYGERGERTPWWQFWRYFGRLR